MKDLRIYHFGLGARINRCLRPWRMKKARRRLVNRDFSLFSSNCNGACICHDLGLPFRSPFVNLWMTAPDFVKLLGAPRAYLAAPLEFLEQTEYLYPVAKLRDVTLYFEHYETEQEAREAWQRRAERICWDKLFVLMTDRDGCTEEVLRAFDALPYRNKAVFTHIPRPDIASAVYIPGFEEDGQVGVCSEFKNGWSGKKWYDHFDYVSWINEGK